MNKRTLSYCAISIVICGFTFPVFAQKCQPSVPLPNATETNIFSEEQEVLLGDAVAEHIQHNYKIIENEDLTAYLATIGQRLIRQLPINRLRLQFFLVDLPDANAFVLPGGRIYLSRKLIASASNEDELAGVIAHELGHLVAHEGATNITRVLKEVLGVTAVGDRADIFDKYNLLIDNLGKKPGALKQRDREKGQLFADQVGMYAIVLAGYDPTAFVRYWDRIAGTQGNTGNWLSEFFGTTHPEEKRLREMSRLAEAVPASCRVITDASPVDVFKGWQTKVVGYNTGGRKEALHGVVTKIQLSPPLLTDIVHLRFSPNGAYVLAQDDAGINVLSREPFKLLFRVECPFDTYYANFTPDSKDIVFYTDNLRVERWSVSESRRTDVKEIVIKDGCLQTALSPDGKLLACLGPDFGLNLYLVESGECVWHRKDAYAPDYFHYSRIYQAVQLRSDANADLSLSLLNMKFSPDGHYFVFGYHGPVQSRNIHAGYVADVIDTDGFTRVSVTDFVRHMIAGGFSFIGNDRIAGINHEDAKKSAIVKFPSGEVLTELELWRKGMTAPTRGEYLLIRPMKDHALGVMDIKTKTFTKVNDHSALDIYDSLFVAEMRNGQVGLFRMEANELVASVVLPNSTLSRLRVAESSSDLKWLALSARQRGGVWNLNKGEGTLALRAFQGAYLSDDGLFFADFPKTEEVDRNIARFNLSNGEAVSGPKIEGNSSHQYGQYLFTIKRAKQNENVKQEFEFLGGTSEGNFDPEDYTRNVIVEVFDARSMKSLWTRSFPKAAPSVWMAPSNNTMTLVWNVSADTAKAEIKSDPKLAATLARMKEKEGDYFLKILDAQTGNEVGNLLVETGKGSFRISNIFAVGDSVIIADTENRVLVYSIKTGEQKGRVFGRNAAVSRTASLLCAENESGKLTVYDLNTMQKHDEFTFPNSISMLRFSQDGKRLLVLTSTQTVYIFDVSAW